MRRRHVIQEVVAAHLNEGSPKAKSEGKDCRDHHGFQYPLGPGNQTLMPPDINHPMSHEANIYGMDAVSAYTATWFIIDSSLSLVSGYGANAVLNLAFALLFGVPLVAIRRELQDAR